MTNEILDISQMDSNIKIYNDKYNVKIIIKELVQIYKKKAEERVLVLELILLVIFHHIYMVIVWDLKSVIYYF